METLEIIIICFVSAIAILIAIIKVREEKHELREIGRRHEEIDILLLIENLLDTGVRLKSVEIDNDGIAWVQLSIQATSKDVENIIEIIKEKRHM